MATDEVELSERPAWLTSSSFNTADSVIIERNPSLLASDGARLLSEHREESEVGGAKDIGFFGGVCCSLGELWITD